MSPGQFEDGSHVRLEISQNPAPSEENTHDTQVEWTNGLGSQCMDLFGLLHDVVL